MKKIFFLLILVICFVLPFCTSTKKAASKHPPRLTYAADIQPLVVANCSPCHIPPKGNKKPFDSYSTVKSDIDEIIMRIQKNPTDRGFMPFKHAKLADSIISKFVSWKSEGLLEN